MKYFLTVLTIALLFIGGPGCKHQPEGQAVDVSGEKTESLAFEGQEFLRQSPSCATDSNRCATILAKYPLAIAGPENVIKRINDTIDVYVRLSLAVFALSPEEMPETLDEIARQFLEEYEAVTTEEVDFVTPWSAELDGKVIYQSPEVVSIQLATYSFAGGAHPNYFTFLFTFDAATGQKLTLKDMVRDTAQLKVLAAAAFREARGLAPDENLSEAGFFWGEDFQLPEYVALTDEGLYCYYNPYEVAAYVMGNTEFTIPWDQLEGLLAPTRK